jgi:arsenite methyltransferase
VGPLPPELDTLLAWLACLADAQPLDRYLDLLTGANFLIDRVEPHNEALSAVVKEIGARLLGAELLLKLNKLDIPGADFGQARNLARHAAKAVRQGNLGYALLVATKTSGD